jgi:hypothetical protein
MQRRLSEEAIMERFEFGVNKQGVRVVKKAVPGVELFTAVSVSLTKV